MGCMSLSTRRRPARGRSRPLLRGTLVSAPFYFNHNQRSALAGSALHFMVGVNAERETRICRYNLDTQQISWINLPPSCSYQYTGRRVMLTSTQYGGLGCARLHNSRLHLWSREVGSCGQYEWAQTRVVHLETMLPSINYFSSLAAFVHGVGVFLVTTGDGLFSIDLDSDRATKVCEDSDIDNVVPYVSFCSTAPALGTSFTGEEPSVGVSKSG